MHLRLKGEWVGDGFLEGKEKHGRFNRSRGEKERKRLTARRESPCVKETDVRRFDTTI